MLLSLSQEIPECAGTTQTLLSKKLSLSCWLRNKAVKEVIKMSFAKSFKFCGFFVIQTMNKEGTGKELRDTEEV